MIDSHEIRATLSATESGHLKVRAPQAGKNSEEIKEPASRATIRDMVCLEYSSGLTDRIAHSGEKNVLSAIGEKPLKVTPIRVTTLTNVIEQSAFRGQHFHYLNVDCEGQDLSVLKGLDFSRYSPDLITVEAFTKTTRAKLTAFLEGRAYELTDIVHLTLFFKKPPTSAV